MPDVLLAIILALSTVLCFVFTMLSFAFMAHCETWKDRLIILGNIVLSIALVVGGWMWLTSGSCKYDGFQYIKIERKDNLKFYIYNGRIFNLDKTIDDKEFKIKMHMWSNRWMHGIYYTDKASTSTEFVPINENLPMEDQ